MNLHGQRFMGNLLSPLPRQLISHGGFGEASDIGDLFKN